MHKVTCKFVNNKLRKTPSTYFYVIQYNNPLSTSGICSGPISDYHIISCYIMSGSLFDSASAGGDFYRGSWIDKNLLFTCNMKKANM